MEREKVGKRQRERDKERRKKKREREKKRERLVVSLSRVCDVCLDARVGEDVEFWAADSPSPHHITHALITHTTQTNSASIHTLTSPLFSVDFLSRLKNIFDFFHPFQCRHPLSLY
jgi:hypothetical protein